MQAWELAGIEGWTGYDSQTNQMRSISGQVPMCIHGKRCPLCAIRWKGWPKVDVDLGPDIDE